MRKKSPRELEKEYCAIWDKEAEKIYPKNEGWCEQTKGFPDKVYFNKNTKKLVLVEVKGGKHPFHKFQKQMIHVLLNGKNTEAIVVSVNKDKEISWQNVATAKAKGWEEAEDFGLIS